MRRNCCILCIKHPCWFKLQMPWDSMAILVLQNQLVKVSALWPVSHESLLAVPENSKSFWSAILECSWFRSGPSRKLRGTQSRQYCSAFNCCHGHIALIRFDFNIIYSKYSMITLLKNDFLGCSAQKGYLWQADYGQYTKLRIIRYERNWVLVFHRKHLYLPFGNSACWSYGKNRSIFLMATFQRSQDHERDGQYPLSP